MAHHEYRVQRGILLKILYRAFPSEVSDRVMALTLNDLHMQVPSGVLSGHCDYLQGKGYVEIDRSGEGDVEFVAKITPRGIDLIEGNIEPDPGIDL